MPTCGMFAVYVPARGRLWRLRLAGLLHLLELFEGGGPVVVEEAREAAVGQQLAPGLALAAVVGLVLAAADALHGRATYRARLPELAVHRHLLVKGRDLVGE